MPPTPRRFTLLLILGALTTISPFSIDMYLPAFTRIAADLGTSVQRVALSLSSYFIGLACGQLLYGPFLDRYGRKPPLAIGLAIYIGACAACALAGSIDMLITMRFLQALGGCAASVAAVAMVRDFFPARERAQVFSKLMLILSVSPMFAPTAGGLIVTAWGWPAVFVSLALIVVLILLAVVFVLPEGHAPDPSVSLSPAAIAREFVAILRHPVFVSFALAGAFSFAGLFTYLAAASAIFMGTFGLSAREFGLVFAVLSVGVVGGGQFNILLMRRFTSAVIFRTALGLQVAIALAYLICASTLGLGFAAQVAIFFAYLACVGLTYPNAAALALAPFDKNTGSAAAMLGFVQMGVGALASAMFGLIQSDASRGLSLLFTATSVVGLMIYVLAPGRHRVGMTA